MKYELLNNFINKYSEKINKIKNIYIELLSELTFVQSISTDKFIENIRDIHYNGYIIVCYLNEPNDDNFDIIGSGTIFIEPKIIRGGRSVGHIEDIVVKEKYRSNNISQHILDILKEIAIEHNCYKVILDCDKNLKNVYLKNGFEEKGIQMALYF